MLKMMILMFVLTMVMSTLIKTEIQKTKPSAFLLVGIFFRYFCCYFFPPIIDMRGFHTLTRAKRAAIAKKNTESTSVPLHFTQAHKCCINQKLCSSCTSQLSPRCTLGQPYALREWQISACSVISSQTVEHPTWHFEILRAKSSAVCVIVAFLSEGCTNAVDN